MPHPMFRHASTPASFIGGPRRLELMTRHTAPHPARRTKASLIYQRTKAESKVTSGVQWALISKLPRRVQRYVSSCEAVEGHFLRRNAWSRERVLFGVH
jgi:hypothetical protein